MRTGGKGRGGGVTALLIKIDVRGIVASAQRGASAGGGQSGVGGGRGRGPQALF